MVERILRRYEYGPFGEVLRATGPMAKANPFRFSTKYQDDETNLLYYGYRYYSPSFGRWISRDPIAEKGGSNLYAFLANNCLRTWDAYGHCGGGCKGLIFHGHYTDYLKPQAAGMQMRSDVVFVGCGANRLNWMWSCISGYPVNQFPTTPPFPDYFGYIKNPNHPDHMPMYPELTDDDYEDQNDASKDVGEAIVATYTTLCGRGCCSVDITVSCQPPRPGDIYELNPNCGKTLHLPCPNLLLGIILGVIPR